MVFKKVSKYQGIGPKGYVGKNVTDICKYIIQTAMATPEFASLTFSSNHYWKHKTIILS